MAVIDGMVVGYAYASQYRARAAYQWNVEVSVYVSSSCHRGGVGRKLYEILIETLKSQGFRNLYAIITLPNEPSTKFHESLGFKYFCVFKNVGLKLNKWYDVGWWVLDLIGKNEIIEAPIPFR